MTLSWIASANEQGCDFPIDNLPYGVFRPGKSRALRCGAAIGDRIVDLADLEGAGLLSTDSKKPVFDQPDGTISGPEKGQYGSLLELSWGGKEPVTLESGARRSFLDDGDTLTIRGWSQDRGLRIGFGESSGTILPSSEEPSW